MGLIRAKLLFFMKTILPIDPFSPFAWWVEHEQQFLDLAYLAHVMGIVGSQIETKRIFSTSRVITCLKCCQFGIKNMDKLILLMKNWLYDLNFKCTSGPKSFEKISIMKTT